MEQLWSRAGANGERRQLRASRKRLNQAESVACVRADESATVVWALSSLHDWQRAAGLGEVQRVLAPEGRVLVAERLVAPGAPSDQAA